MVASNNGEHHLAYLVDGDNRIVQQARYLDSR